jgi:uncharacterized protein (TIGR02611 family)
VRGLPGGWVAWRVAVSLLGVAVIAIGVILLPLPGPGWVVIFAGLGVLATEYAWAARLLKWVRTKVVEWTRWLAGQPVWVRVVFGLATLALLAVIIWAAWLVAGRPGL